MKIPHRPNKTSQGNALIIVVCLSVILCFAIGSYLYLVQFQFRANARSQNWNTALTLAEAGVEDGLAYVNENAGGPSVYNWNSSPATDNWTVSGNVYHMERSANTNLGYYDVWVTNNGSYVSILSAGTATWNYQYASISSSQPFLATAGLPSFSGGALPTVRKILVIAQISSHYPGGMAAIGTINMNGNNVTTDSFDSSDPNYSSWNSNLNYGVYSSSKRKSNGNVSTDDTITDSLSIGNANIYGHLNTGPGGTAYVGSNGSVGDTNWVGSHSGIQTGYSADDMNVAFPPVVLPTPGSGWSTVTGNSINGSGYYEDASSGGLSSSLTVSGSNVVLYLANGLSYSGNKTLTINTNSSVTIYVGGSFSIAGNATLNNLTSNALCMTVYGLTNCTSVSLGGNAAFTGSLYAPQAALSLGGGGNNTYDFVGATITASVSMNGHFNFHYDEHLSTANAGLAFVPTSWKEL